MRHSLLSSRPACQFRGLLPCLVLLLTGLAAAAPGEKPGPPDVVTVEIGDLRVEFAGDRAWTIRRIVHRSEVITDVAGFYGTVFSPQGGRWIGTGHNEGGVEKIESVTLTVDGQACALQDRAHYRGQRAELRKRSRMGSFALEATYAVTGEAVLERHRYETVEPVKVGILYAFMHPFVPQTREWLAATPDGRRLAGAFDSSGGFRLKEDVRWTAVFDPTRRRATLVWYPTPLVGQGLKTAYWDKTVYHKLYNQVLAQAELAAGTRFETELVLRCVEAAAEDWQKRMETLADETARQHAAGKLAF